MDSHEKIKNPIRTLSGVTPIAVLTKPYPCPGRCAFCPTEKGMPKSYLSKEPAAQRAKLSNFDPKVQVNYRIRQYEITNHPTDKIELIILGGTWSYYPKRYQSWFIKSCIEICNGNKSKSLEEAQKKNEKAKYRIVGITIETRPDYITIKEVKRLRMLGVTRVELGVQSVYDEVLMKNCRDHHLKDVIHATTLLKNAGFKITYHIMPNLPGSTLEKDTEMFRILFTSSHLQPDMLKIYPCVLLKNTKAYQWYKTGTYKPYTTEQLVDLAIHFKQYIPPYIRINRLYRDIPKEYVQHSSTVSNIREHIHWKMQKEGLYCQCIRCREIKNETTKPELTLNKISYKASLGEEIFLEYIDSVNRIYGLLRLRINHTQKFIPFKSLKNTAIIRELHIYGQSEKLHHKGNIQHQGLGKKLISEAERIAKKEFQLFKIAVISGIGVRTYYEKLGYHLEKSYMVKKLL